MRAGRSRGVSGGVGRLFSAVRGRKVNATVASPLSFEGSSASISGRSGGVSRTSVTRGGKAGAFAATMSLVAVLAAFPAGAVAEQLANLGSFGTPNGSQGGQLSFARGLATNLSGVGGPAGSVYVAESDNNRISQFTADGGFVRAWGFDVVDGVGFPGAANDNGTGFEICDVTAGNTTNQCKAGLAGGAAGQLNVPVGIAVDQSNGFLYVTSNTNRRVDVFSGTGQFAGAFGFDVLPGDPNPSGPDFCTTATGCQTAAAAGPAAGRWGNPLPFVRPAVDPSVPGKVYVPNPGNVRMDQYSTTIAGGVLTAVSFDKAFGWDVVPANAETGLESCTIATTCKAGTSGAGAGQFALVTLPASGSPTSAAVDSTGAIYAISGHLFQSGVCRPTTPCRIQKFSPDATSVTDFGPVSGPGQVHFSASQAANTVAAFDIAVDPVDDHVLVLRRESSTSYKVLEFDSAGNFLDAHPGGAALPGPTQTTGNGLAIGTDDRVYTNVGGPGAGQVFILGPIDPPTVAIAPVSEVGSTTATFTGTVTIPPPGAPTFDTLYRFEYSKNGVDWTKTPVLDATVAGGEPGPHTVSQQVTGLDPNSLYSVRLVATNGPSATSSPVTFTTDAVGPRIDLTFVDQVTKTDARFGAHIDPQGLPTTYHFEWGPTAAYGNQVPAFERQIGSGHDTVIANEPIDGLEKESTYHYRVVATSYCHPTEPGDTTPTDTPCVTEGPDQTFETLNDCGLTDGRCYEMVSPSDKGAVGAAGDIVALGQQLQFQAARDRPALQYSIAYGLEGATTGNEVAYLAERDSSGWATSQLDADSVWADTPGPGATSSRLAGLSANLGCSVLWSVQPMGDDPPIAAHQAGGSVIYRRDSVGEWTPVTSSVPTNAGLLASLEEHWLVGMSEGELSGGCERVVFRSGLHYAEAPGAGLYRLYSWENGTLTYVGVIPGPGGPEVVEAIPGAVQNTGQDTVGNFQVTDYWNAVSDDASRIFFTAVSRIGGDAGQQAVFLREAGSSVAIDVSQSKTGVANDDDSTYQTASTDGSKVFFVARTGLAANDPAAGPAACAQNSGDHVSSGDGRGCDLYMYSRETDALVDLSKPDGGIDNPGGAGVVGMLGASDDGEYAYFAARGQLVAGEGQTEAENIADDTYSVYLARSGSGELRYIGRISERDAARGLIIRSSDKVGWSARVTPDGEHLLFGSQENVTGYVIDPNPDDDVFEAYLYDAETDSTVCVSCRRDGGQPVPAVDLGEVLSAGYAGPLTTGSDVENRYSPPLTVTDDGRRVFFVSYNILASGAIAGQLNLYQWEEGQISFIATSGPTSSRRGLRFGGASRDGSDVYFSTVDRMTWQDTDGKMDVYDARVGGGFAEPAAPEAPCDPMVEEACQGPGGSRMDQSVETDGAGSGNQALPPRATFSVGRLSRAQLGALVAGRRASLAVRVSRPGRVSLLGTASIGGLRATVISGSRDATAAGRIAVAVVLSKAARRRIVRSGSLRVTLTVRFDGARKGAVRKLMLKKARPATTDRRAGK